jgi:hypothetical protein
VDEELNRRGVKARRRGRAVRRSAAEPICVGGKVPGPRLLCRRLSGGAVDEELNRRGRRARRRGRAVRRSAAEPICVGRKGAGTTTALPPVERGGGGRGAEPAGHEGSQARGWGPYRARSDAGKAMRLRTVRAPGGGCHPRRRWILSGGDCVSADGGKLVNPRMIDLERSRLAERSGANLRGEVAVSAAAEPPVELGVVDGRAAPGGALRLAGGGGSSSAQRSGADLRGGSWSSPRRPRRGGTRGTCRVLRVAPARRPGHAGLGGGPYRARSDAVIKRYGFARCGPGGGCRPHDALD